MNIDQTLINTVFMFILIKYHRKELHSTLFCLVAIFRNVTPALSEDLNAYRKLSANFVHVHYVTISHCT
jgi:hypothetical protein